MAATLQVAGRRAHKLSSSYPRPGRSHAEPCRSRRPSLHATSCYGESFASSTVARSSSTLLRRFERLFWLDGESATCARSRLSAQNGRQIYLAASRLALAIRAFALMISVTCSRSACRISRRKGTGHSIIGTWPRSQSAWRLAATCFEGPVSRRHISHDSRAWQHGFAYYIMSQSTVGYLERRPADMTGFQY